MATVSVVLVSLLNFILNAHAQTCQPETEARVRGDVILGGFFNIHTQSADGRECGAYVDLHAIERLEAALFAIDLINTVAFIPGVRFGLIAYDTCGLRHVATQKALRWLAEKNYRHQRDKCQVTPMHLGVIGPMYTGPAQDIASLLTSAQMTQISYSAAGSSVDDRTQYPYLLRTGPNGKMASKVILDILEEYGWTDIVVITGTGVDEQDRKHDLYQMAGSNGKCIMVGITVDPKISGFEKIVEQLEEAINRGVTGVVVLTLPKPTEILFTKVQDSLLAHPDLWRLHWVLGLPFTDSVTYHNLKDAIKGMVTFSIHPQPVRGFREYFTSLLPGVNLRNPWFRTFWEQTLNCTVNRTCDQGHVTTYRQTYRQAAGVAQTVAAVYAFAQGLKDAHRDVCGYNHTEGICPALGAVSPDRLIRYLYKSTFVNLDGQIVAFDKNGDLARPIFSIYNVQLDGVSYRLRKIGTWTESKGLRLKSRIKVYDVTGRSSSFYPTSSCRYKCLCRNKLDDDRYGIMEGDDLVLQGIFDIHGGNVVLEADPRTRPPLVSECGGLPHTEALQAMEAMFYAIDLINEDKDILPGVSLGAATFDSCRSADRAVRHTENLLSGKVQITPSESRGIRPIATVGAALSDVSMAVARLLAPLKVTQVSYGAAATELNDKKAYPYFLRTVGTAASQAQAVVDLILTYNWTYVKVVFSNNVYGQGLVEEFLTAIEGTPICIATQVQLDGYLIHNEVAMRNIVQYYFLEAYVEARVVVMFVTDDHARKVLASLRSLIGHRRSHDLVWVATDQWGTKASVPETFEDLITGAITLTHAVHLVPDFLTYFQGLQPWNNDRNPWLAEFWQHHFRCYLSGDFARVYNTSCDPSLTLNNELIIMASQVPLVIDAVYSIALGLHNLISDHCGVNFTGLCEHANNNLHQLHTYVKGIHFYNGVTKTAVSFDKLGSATPRLQVNNYRQTAEGVYEYVEVGTWQSGQLTLDPNKLEAPSSTPGQPIKASSLESRCTSSSENRPCRDEEGTADCPSSGCVCSTRTVAQLEYELLYNRLTLLGYFPVHQQGSDGSPCSQLRTKEGFEVLMAFRYAIERINRDPNLLNNVTLGYMIFDTCSDPSRARVAFDSFDRSLRFFSQPPQSPVVTYVHAFVGGIENEVSQELHQASMHGQHLVQISPGSSSEVLTDRTRYPRFLRTLPASIERAHALVALVKTLEWSYVGLVHDGLAVNLELQGHVEKVMYENGLCIGMKVKLAEADDLQGQEKIVRLLSKVKGEVGVIVLASMGGTVAFLSALKRSNAVGKFVLIGTELWGEESSAIEGFHGLHDVIRGSLAVVPHTTRDVYFDMYMRRVTPNQDDPNPWIKEFWEEHFRCDLTYGGKFGRACTGLETLENATFATNFYAINTINAVYAYAYGISRLFEERCGAVVIPPCDLLLGGKRTSALVYDYIRSVRFTGADGSLFSFSEAGDGPSRFKVLNYHQGNQGDAMTGGYVKVGLWESGLLTLNRSLVQMYDAEGEPADVKSECPGTCNCSRSDVLVDSSAIPLQFTAHRTVWGILVLTFSLMGIVFCLVIIIFFILKLKHPVVEGATCSVSVLLLLTLVLLYLLNFAFMCSETRVTCGIRRFSLGFLYVTMVNVLLVKAGRIYRLNPKVGLCGGCMGGAGDSGSGGNTCSQGSSHSSRQHLHHSNSQQPPETGGPAQCLAVLVLSGIQLVLGVQWLIIAPPGTESYLYDVSSDEESYPVYVVRWRCQHSRAGLAASSSYVFLLLLVTIFLSARLLRVRHFQHESLYLLASAITTFVSLLSWVLLYTLLEEQESVNAATCVILTIIASLTLVLVFGRKMLELTASPVSRRSGFSDPYDDQYAVPRRDKSSVKGPNCPEFPLAEGFM